MGAFVGYFTRRAGRMDAKDQAMGLVGEFRQAGLTDCDARRSAFCAFAHSKGWNAARIGRYMGISRHRVGQRVDRFHKQVETKDMPLLAGLLESARTPNGSGADLPISYPVDIWEDPDFAWGLIRLVAAET